MVLEPYHLTAFGACGHPWGGVIGQRSFPSRKMVPFATAHRGRSHAPSTVTTTPIAKPNTIRRMIWCLFRREPPGCASWGSLAVHSWGVGVALVAAGFVWLVAALVFRSTPTTNPHSGQTSPPVSG